MRKVVLPLALLSSVFADGSAHAQCAPTDPTNPCIQQYIP